MTLTEIVQWCDYHWTTSRSDVVKLILTDESLHELSLEVAAITYFDPDDIVASQTPVGLKVAEIVNPVTQSTIEVVNGSQGDLLVLQIGSVLKVAAE